MSDALYITTVILIGTLITAAIVALEFYVSLFVIPYLIWP